MCPTVSSLDSQVLHVPQLQRVMSLTRFSTPDVIRGTALILKSSVRLARLRSIIACS